MYHIHWILFSMNNEGKQHLHRPVSVWLSDAQVDEAGHRQTHVEPVAEAEVVDELEHVLHTQEDQTHQPLWSTNRYSHVPQVTFARLRQRNLNEEENVSHVEEQCRYGCVALRVDQTQTVGEVALSGANKKQPA